MAKVARCSRLAAARTNPPDTANPVLLRLLDELPGHAALGLAESGTLSELPALERAYKSTTGWEREADRADDGRNSQADEEETLNLPPVWVGKTGVLLASSNPPARWRAETCK